MSLHNKIKIEQPLSNLLYIFFLEMYKTWNRIFLTHIYHGEAEAGRRDTKRNACVSNWLYQILFPFLSNSVQMKCVKQWHF